MLMQSALTKTLSKHLCSTRLLQCPIIPFFLHCLRNYLALRHFPQFQNGFQWLEAQLLGEWTQTRSILLFSWQQQQHNSWLWAG